MVPEVQGKRSMGFSQNWNLSDLRERAEWAEMSRAPEAKPQVARKT